jgi:hypothetical protein
LRSNTTPTSRELRIAPGLLKLMNGLFDLPFPVEYADDGLGFQRMNEYLVQTI